MADSTIHWMRLRLLLRGESLRTATKRGESVGVGCGASGTSSACGTVPRASFERPWADGETDRGASVSPNLGSRVKNGSSVTHLNGLIKRFRNRETEFDILKSVLNVQVKLYNIFAKSF